jgi:hypothetical protein
LDQEGRGEAGGEKGVNGAEEVNVERREVEGVGAEEEVSRGHAQGEVMIEGVVKGAPRFQDDGGGYGGEMEQAETGS